jgi:hypothetical protein
MLAAFNDHYAVALSSVKALQDGQVVPAAAIAASPGFLGWLDPSAAGASAATSVPLPVPAPPMSAATDAPAPAALANAPMQIPTG